MLPTRAPKYDTRTELPPDRPCPECGGDEAIRDRESDETVCRRYGLVLHEAMLTRTPEWRAFTREEQYARERAGLPTSFKQLDEGLSTTFHLRVEKKVLSKDEWFTMRRK